MKRRLAAMGLLVTGPTVLVLSRTAAAGPSDARAENGLGAEGQRSIPGSKNVGINSPHGRTIYRSEETFDDAVDIRRRIFVIEAAAGLGPEGNLGLVLGWMPKALHGVEFYGGAGVEINPAIHVSGAVRFLFNIGGVRPYLGVGYFYKDMSAIETYAHHAFVEGGHSWKLGPANHLTVGVGVARLVYIGVRAGSVLRASDVDPRSLDEQVGSVPSYLPTFAIRFSRAF